MKSVEAALKAYPVEPVSRNAIDKKYGSDKNESKRACFLQGYEAAVSDIAFLLSEQRNVMNTARPASELEKSKRQTRIQTLKWLLQWFEN